jgi:methylase of polypeptide subunit release factors
VNGTATGTGRPAPPSASDGKALTDLRVALQAADYTAESIEDTLGVGELSAAPAEAAVHRRRLAGDDPFSTLARLFVLGDVLDGARVNEAVSPLALDRLEALGLVEADGAGFRATVRLLPHGDYYVASDAIEDEPSPDWVPGIQAPSVTLAKLAVRNHVPATLDLGTGCGIQALLAAKHSDRVVATDLNARALAFAAFNAALNEIGPVEFRRGSLLDPAADERFGLIVANPPYVISPDSTYMYRDGGYPGDELCRQIVAGVPRHLAEGGFAHVLVSWVHSPGAEWADPLREWVRGSGCDAWLLHYKTDDPLSHSAGWLGPLATAAATEHETALERWLGYLEDSGIEAIGYGAVVLRRRSGAPNWVRLDELPLDRLEPASEHTLRVFAAEDFLAELPDERQLLEERFELVDAHRLDQQLVCRDGRFEVESQTLALAEGLAFRAGLDRSSAMLLPHFRAGRRLADVLAAAGADLGVDAADRERFALAALAVVRRLFELGFVVRSTEQAAGRA